MSWCDKLASTPTIGIGFEPFHVSSATVLDLIAPLLNKLGDEKEPGYTIEKLDALGILLTQDAGFQYGIDSRRMFIEFKHRMKVRPVSGSAPRLDMISKPEPFTKMIAHLQSRIVELYSLLDAKGVRALLRIGVVSTTIVDRKEIPPGIEKFISYLQAPWGAKSESLNFSLMGDLNDEAEWSDRCHHTVSDIENEKGMLSLKFDFQRTFKAPVATKSAKLDELLPIVTESALEYFESLAEGGRFDVNRN